MAEINRRDMLKIIGASAASLGAAGSWAWAAETKPAGKRKRQGGPRRADLPAKAKKNIKLGIMSSVYAGLPVADAAKRIKDDGFSCVVLEYSFKDARFNPCNPDWAVLKKITTAFDKSGIEIAGLYGYHNVIDPNEANRKRNEQMIGTIINNWQRFGSPIISTETGSFNKTSQFEQDPKNFTEEGYKAAVKAFTNLARAAEKTKAIIAIEGYWKNLICSVDRAEQLFKDVNNPSLKLTMDPCNYYRNEDLPNMDHVLRDMFKRIGPQTVLAHAKDVKATENGGQDLPAAGKGVMDYPLFLRLLTRLDKPMPLIIEHLTIEDVSRARDYVKAQMEKI